MHFNNWFVKKDITYANFEQLTSAIKLNFGVHMAFGNNGGLQLMILWLIKRYIKNFKDVIMSIKVA